MDSIQERDETVIPIHDALKRAYYKQIVILAILTGLSILFSLGMTYLNGIGLSWIGWLVGPGFLLNVIVIAGAIWLVTRIIDPDRYGKKATSLLEEEEKKLPERGKITTRSEFFNAYVDLEKTIRDFLGKQGLYELLTSRSRMNPSFRQMIEELVRAEIINYSVRSELL